MITNSKIGDTFLNLERCPHCQTAMPTLKAIFQNNYMETYNHQLKNRQLWGVYQCSFCGGLISICSEAFQSNPEFTIAKIFPPQPSFSFDRFPEEAVRYLKQAAKILEQQDSAIMTIASAVDAMLQAKECKGHNLNKKIDNAVEKGIFTEDMKKWADNIRLQRNDSSHPKENILPPAQNEAKQCFEFAMTLGEILFVLPAKVARGLKETEKPPEPNNA